MLKDGDDVLPFLKTDKPFKNDGSSGWKLLIILFAIFVGIYAGFSTPDFAYYLTKDSQPFQLLDEKCYIIGESILEAYKKNPYEFPIQFDARNFYQKLSKHVQLRKEYYSIDPLHFLVCIYLVATVIFLFQHCSSKCAKKNGLIFGVFFDTYFLSLLLIGLYKLLIFYDYFNTKTNDCIQKILY